MTKETWKMVPSFPEIEASSIGRVRRIPFKVKYWNGAIRSHDCRANCDGERGCRIWEGKGMTMTIRDWAQVVLSVVGVVAYFLMIWLVAQCVGFSDRKRK